MNKLKIKLLPKNMFYTKTLKYVWTRVLYFKSYSSSYPLLWIEISFVRNKKSYTVEESYKQQRCYHKHLTYILPLLGSEQP